ncbi:esterase-like activity of phytase family protein [Novosphingobium lindaniclasticum]|nr:esterase-like activity of phytase family protein [Novosphingobium lindaniclasticum]
MAPGIRFLGALDLSSPRRHFGGLSSLRWESGWLHALSDEDGAWYALRPRERGGRLVGIDQARTTNLLDSDGAPLVGKRKSDAEAMEFVHSCKARSCSPSAVLVALERDHRVLRYELSGGLPAGRPARLGGMDSWLARQPDNEGVEAMASDESGTLLISEGLRTPGGEAAALLVSPPLGTSTEQTRRAQDIAVPAPGSMRPSDLVALGGGRFILLRRSWSEAAGFAVAVEELTLRETTAKVHEIIRLAPPFISENFEGVALRKAGDRAFLYFIADDNFEPSQRTLLLKFELPT